MTQLSLDSSILKKLHSKFYTTLEANPLINPKLVSINTTLAKKLGFDHKQLDSQEFVKFLNGEYLLNGSKPYAFAYSGHQFGYFVPNLGDGRALNLGKLQNYHLQLKGSGITPYSRDGDGRAVLRSSIREYLISEAMHRLGIPTTRALALITSDTKVLREYSHEQGAIVLRASPSWIRFGSFEYAYMGKDKETSLINLANHLIDEGYPELEQQNNKYEELYFKIVDRTIELLALWQSVGFMHGVMNTDNMSALGLTIDYGPYAMMEEFDKGFICNLSDHEGRYSFENQPFIAQWNLSVLAKVLSPIADHKLMESYNDSFIGKFKKRYFSIMKEKLGLYNKNIADKKLILQLFNAMQDDKIDYTSFFYKLSKGLYDSFNSPNISKWLEKYKLRLELEELPKSTRFERMLKLNPKYILRNYMLQDAIDAAENGNFTLVNDLLEIVHNPYREFSKYEHYTKPKSNFKPLKCSCSS
jgi:serine/tyrosine/threonine adenylyltransferase